MTNPYPGQVVYPHCTPVKAGVITEVIERRTYSAGRYAGEASGEYVVRVKWDNKKHGETVESSWSLRDYEALVLDHERKAKNQRAILDRIRGGK